MNRLIIMTLAIFSTGCAAMLKGTKDDVVFQAGDGHPTSFAINGVPVAGGAEVPTAMASVKTKGNTRATVTATREGCAPVTVPLQTSFAPVSLWGIVWDFGLISMGLIDGAATGAAVRTDPVQVVTPVCAKE